jgi:hypothetical protein
VVHLLIPHPPFDVDAECQGFPTPAARDRANDVGGGPASWMPPFAGQTRCALQLLDSLFATVDSVAGRQRSIIIVHGDHGPRLSTFPGKGPPTAIADYDPATLNNHFSTLFAIRLPNGAPTVVAAAAPIQDLLWELVGEDFAKAGIGPWAHHVVVPNRPPAPAADTLRPMSSADLVWLGDRGTGAPAGLILGPPGQDSATISRGQRKNRH